MIDHILFSQAFAGDDGLRVEAGGGFVEHTIHERINARVFDGAQKRMMVSIQEASCVQEFNAMKYVVDIEMAAGDMPAKQFSGYQRLWSGRALGFTVTAATLNAVLEAFKDEEILNYLEK